MSRVSERDNTATYILNGLYDKAIKENISIDETIYKDLLDNLFMTTAWGFREVLLVVIVAMKLSENYRASTGFYDCNPRPLYEESIKSFLIDKNIPHRKSGPLNVAKATEGLNSAWAAQRRPRDAAENVVQLVNILEQSKTREIIDNMGVSLLRRLISESKRVEELHVDIQPSANSDWLYSISYELISKTPDAGNTPQKIAAFLLESYHSATNTKIRVTGSEDRASVTSTTSKKPGDVNEEAETGEIYKVYEVTVKPFDIARIRDSYDCVKIFNEKNNTNLNEIVVICRPEDCPDDLIESGLHLCLGNYEYQDMTYYYWDIYEWTLFMLQRMTPFGRELYYHRLNGYVSDINTAEKVKTLWQQLHNET